LQFKSIVVEEEEEEEEEAAVYWKFKMLIIEVV
jgi:hypothetical protein